ncbi:MAG: DUF2341 domain-containing protein [Bacteroidales bacterium]|nr:DUF2341 domain-containing protein [Bacteroidales bacterium]
MKRLILLFIKQTWMILFMLITFTSYSQGCYSDWQYKKIITIDNTSGYTLKDYELKLIVDTKTPVDDGYMQSDGRDILFTDMSCCNELGYYIESAMNTDTTVIWVNVSHIRAGSIDTIHMLYGNPLADAASDPNNTFSFWEGFDSLPIKFSSPCGSFSTDTIIDGILNLAWSSNGVIISDDTLPISSVYTVEAQIDSKSGTWPSLFWTKVNSHTSYAMLTNSNSACISYSGTSTDFCQGHNFATTWYPYSSATGIWSLTWVNTGNLFGDFPSVGTISTTNTMHTRDEDLQIMLGGVSSGTGSMNVDWVRARKYAPIIPSYFVGEEMTHIPAPRLNDLGADRTIFCGVTLDAGSGFLSYNWNDDWAGQTIDATSTGAYSIMARAERGCVAIDTVNLDVIEEIFIIEQDTICYGDNYTFPDGTSLSHVYFDMVDTSALTSTSSGFSCDSNVVVYLHIDNNFTEYDTICKGDDYTFPDGVTVANITNDTVYACAFDIPAECDSVITTYIVIRDNIIINDTICKGSEYGLPDGTLLNNVTRDTTCVFTYTSNIYGCDSTITVNLIIRDNFYYNLNICYGDSFTFPDGITEEIIKDTVRVFSYISQNYKCDSIITVDIKAIKIDITVTKSGSSLRSNELDADNYQWLDCSKSYRVINGEDSRSFNPDNTGNYAVEVTKSGCVDTSSCRYISIVGVVESSFDKEIILSPNPTTGAFTIEFGTELQDVLIKVRNIAGIEVKNLHYFDCENISLDIEGADGIYLVEIISGKDKAIYKVIKNK